MLSKPDRHQLLAIYKISRGSDWKEVDRMLREELSRTQNQMVDTIEVVSIHRLQGRAALLQELLKLVEDAPGRLQKQGVSTL